jgi:hypothetical protein
MLVQNSFVVVVDTYQHLVRDTVLIRWPRPAFGGHFEAGSNACNYTTQHMDNVGPQQCGACTDQQRQVSRAHTPGPAVSSLVRP